MGRAAVGGRMLVEGKEQVREKRGRMRRLTPTTCCRSTSVTECTVVGLRSSRVGNENKEVRMHGKGKEEERPTNDDQMRRG